MWGMSYYIHFTDEETKNYIKFFVVKYLVCVEAVVKMKVCMTA